jgi:hypothetical protein
LLFQDLDRFHYGKESKKDIQYLLRAHGGIHKPSCNALFLRLHRLRARGALFHLPN